MGVKIILILFCGAAIALTLVLIQNVPVASILVLLFFAIVIVMAATLSATWLANGLMVVASLAAALAILEGACLPWTHTIALAGTADLIAQGGPLGWTLKPGAHPVTKTLDGRVVYDVRYGVDALGHRAIKAAGPGAGIAFLGDSFTFGEGIADADTWPQAFADLFGGALPVVDLGVPAYSPAQVLRELQLGLYDDVLAPAKAFVFLTAAWHADRVACKQDFVLGAPRFRVVDGTLRSDGSCPPLPHSALERFLMQTATYQVLVASRRLIVDGSDIATYIAVVTEAARVARTKYHVPLVVIYLRNAGYLHFTGYSDDDILATMRANGVEAIDLTLPDEGRPAVVIAGDGHPNGNGNRIRAKLLRDALQTNNPHLLAP